MNAMNKANTPIYRIVFWVILVILVVGLIIWKIIEPSVTTYTTYNCVGVEDRVNSFLLSCTKDIKELPTGRMLDVIRECRDTGQVLNCPAVTTSIILYPLTGKCVLMKGNTLHPCN